MFVVDAMSDHMVRRYSSIGLVMPLYVASNVSFCLPHLVDERTLMLCVGISSVILICKLRLVLLSAVKSVQLVLSELSIGLFEYGVV